MRKMRVLLSVTAASCLAITSLAGCTSAAERKEVPSSSPTETYPALRVEQVDPILKAINSALAAGDAKIDAGALKPRVAGPALTMRTAQYQMHQKNDRAVPTALPASSEITTVTSGNKWPRALLNVTGADSSGAKYVEIIRQNQALSTMAVDAATAQGVFARN